MLQLSASLFLVAALCFFVSRALLRLPALPKGLPGLRLAHVGSALGLIVLDAAVKFPAGGFVPTAAAMVLVLQFVWYGVDRLMGTEAPGPAR